jgi:hypothetical protein
VAHRKNLTAFEARTGWKYSIIATNIGRMWGIAVPWAQTFALAWQRLTHLPALA